MASTVKFFESVSGYSAPLQPKREISEAEISSRRAYYRAEFDAAQRVTRITKMLDSEVDVEFGYTYDEVGKLIGATIARSGGEHVPIELSSTLTRGSVLRA